MRVIVAIIKDDYLYINIPNLLRDYVKSLTYLEPSTREILDIVVTKGERNSYTASKGVLYYSNIIYIPKDYILYI
jgi:hypothetical protein